VRVKVVHTSIVDIWFSFSVITNSMRRAFSCLLFWARHWVLYIHFFWSSYYPWYTGNGNNCTQLDIYVGVCICDSRHNFFVNTLYCSISYYIIIIISANNQSVEPVMTRHHENVFKSFRLKNKILSWHVARFLTAVRRMYV